jgi:hypothetical protein
MPPAQQLRKHAAGRNSGHRLRGERSGQSNGEQNFGRS